MKPLEISPVYCEQVEKRVLFTVNWGNPRSFILKIVRSSQLTGEEISFRTLWLTTYLDLQAEFECYDQSFLTLALLS